MTVTITTAPDRSSVETAPVTTPAEPATTYQLPGVSWLGVARDENGVRLSVGPVTIPVQLTTSGTRTARIEADLSNLTLAQLSQAATDSGGTDPMAALPSSLAAFLADVAIAHVGVTLDLDAHAVDGIDLRIVAGSPWVVASDRLAVEDLELMLSVARAGDSTTIEVSGVAAVLGSAVHVVVDRDAVGAFTVSMAADLPLPSIGAVAQLVGADDLASHLPPGLEVSSSLAVSDLVVGFGTAGSIDKIGALVSTQAGWTLPDPIGLSLDHLGLRIEVEHPTEAALRSVAVRVEAEAGYAGATIVVRLERDADTQEWTLSGGLQPGTVLTASAVARHYGVGVPAHLPDLVLSALTAEAKLGRGEFTVAAASTTEWTVPVGPDGLGIANLAVTFNHHEPDADGHTFGGSIAGEIHLACVVVPVSYAMPGGLLLTAVVPTIAPFALLRDVCGDSVLDTLALPAELTQLAMTDLHLRIDVERAELSFAATAPGFQRVQAVVRKGTSWGFAVGIRLADDYRLSSLSPDLKGLKDISLPKGMIVVSSFDDAAFTFDELQPPARTGVERGVLIDAELDLAGLGADTFLGRASLDVEAHVGPSLSDLSLDAGVGDIQIAPGVRLKDAEFTLVPNPENVSVGVSGAVDVTIDDSPLEFVGGVRVLPNGISFFAEMKGTWREPFGVRGIAVDNVALTIGSDFEGVPTIGIDGGLQIGTFTGDAAVLFNSQLPSQSVLKVDFNHLPLLDVVTTFCPPSLAPGIPAEVRGTLNGISLDDVHLYVVPQDTAIAEITYEQGLRVGGTLHVAGFTAEADVEVEPATGISAKGSMSAVHVGDVFSLTAADSTTEGPRLDIEVTTSAVPVVSISGRASLLGLSAAADVELSDYGFSFDCSGQVFGLFDAAVNVRGAQLQSADGFQVHADLHQSFLDDLGRRVAEVLHRAGQDASDQIAQAAEQVDAARAELNRLGAASTAARKDLDDQRAAAQTKLGEAQEKLRQATQVVQAIDGQIASVRTTIQAERDAAAAGLRSLQAKVSAAQAPVDAFNAQIASSQQQIDRLNAEISYWNGWYSKLAWYDKAWGWTRLGAEVGWRSTQITALNGTIAGLRGSKGAADLALSGAQEALRKAQAAAATYPVDADPRILKLQTDRATAQVGLQLAQQGLAQIDQATSLVVSAAERALSDLVAQTGQANVVLQQAGAGLDGLRKAVGDVADVAGYVAVHGIGALLNVRSTSFDGDLNSTSGGSVTLDATLDFRGATQLVHVGYDFHDLLAGARAVAKAVLPSAII